MKRIGLVCRWKPVHKGHAVLLETLCERSEHVLVGLGSPNKRDEKNPFTAEESARMIELVLAPRFRNYDFVLVPDLGDGPRWAAMVRGMFGALDLFVTANAWVRDLMRPYYPVEHPGRIVPQEKHVAIDGTLVRKEMARGEEWRRLVPPPVERFLDEAGLVGRYRSEFAPGDRGAEPRASVRGAP